MGAHTLPGGNGIAAAVSDDMPVKSCVILTVLHSAGTHDASSESHNNSRTAMRAPNISSPATHHYHQLQHRLEPS